MAVDLSQFDKILVKYFFWSFYTSGAVYLDTLKCKLIPTHCLRQRAAVDKATAILKLAGQNLGRAFNFRHGRAFAPCTSFITQKLHNLKWKTWPL